MVAHKLEKGYKPTELGPIPEDWEVQNISDNSTLKARIGWQGLTTAEYLGSGNFFLVTGTDFNNGKIDWDTCVYVDENRYSQDKNIQLRIGDVLVTKDGTIGKIAYIDKLPFPATLNSGIFVIRPKKKAYHPRFLFYILSSNYFIQFLKKLQAGSTINHLYQKDFESFNFVVPEYSEQERIADVLSDIDDFIESLDNLIEKKKNIKQGAVQELLTGRKRLANFHGDWVVKKLPEVCWFQEGPGLRNWQFTKEGMKVINVTNLENGYLNLERTDRYISLGEFDRMYRHFEIDDGDIVMASSGNSYAKVAVVRKQDLPLMMNTSVIRFKPREGIDYKFVLEFLKSKNFKDQIDLLITGGAQPNFGPAHLKMIQVSVPPTKDEQSTIADMLFDMDLEIEELERIRDKYKNLKIGMMQQLLTGGIRVKWKS